ncbi:unnamed protein product [Allacma fusca]|uniref:Uncharacterized protein n=1 Tax=Allacma fusca TaxID=39272 RepID=A0A8J2JLY1_9HEXA|nr:unnamed protein product [Allacma fusca]
MKGLNQNRFGLGSNIWIASKRNTRTYIKMFLRARFESPVQLLQVFPSVHSCSSKVHQKEVESKIASKIRCYNSLRK